MTQHMRLSIIIPAFNEEARIGRMLDAYLPFFSRLYDREFEFIVVINGSTDRTEEIVAGYAKQHPQIQTIVEPRSVGKGGAIILGFSRAQGEMIGFVDADGSTPPEAFQDLVDKIGNAGAIIGSRWAKGADVRPRQPLSRRLASRVFNLLVVPTLLGYSFTDTQCGAKLMTREAVNRVLPILTAMGITHWAFDVDLLFKLRRAGFEVKETPSVWHDVSGSRVKVVRASAEMIIALTRLRLLYSPFRCVVTLYDRTLGRIIHPG
ncbi:dolichyl-phosphate beta-glucosyltransferase [Verrucomicrobiota bacterium]